MKTLSLWFLMFACAGGLAFAQDDATQQQIDRLSGQIRDLQATQLLQTKRIEDLEKELGDLHDKVGAAGSSDNAYASADDLKKLADQVQEIDKKRQADRDLILKEIEKLGRVGGSTSSHHSTPTATATATTAPTTTTSTSADGKQTGYEYQVQRNDTLILITKAYRQQGIKVSLDDILKANPGLDPKNLKVGQKIFIPAPAQ